MKKVSVIVPLYNKAPYIKNALDSIAVQTYQDFELIIINDGSTDDSAAIAKQWIQENSCGCGCRLVAQLNAGVSAARNRGIAESKGDYLAFLDADDWWEPTFLEELARFAEQYPEAGLWACNYIYYKPGKTHVAINNIETGYFNYPQKYYEGSAMPITSISVMIPKKVIDEVGGFPVGIKLGEDFLLWSRIALSYQVAFLNRSLAYYNNDIPAAHRATRNLHAPEYHMLWNMDFIPETEDWKKLFDKLRVTGLYPYWLSKEYHDVTKEELKKVDWTILNDWDYVYKYKQLYQLPLCLLRWRQSILTIGSYFKQQLLRIYKC